MRSLPCFSGHKAIFRNTKLTFAVIKDISRMTRLSQWIAERAHLSFVWFNYSPGWRKKMFSEAISDRVDLDIGEYGKK